MSIISGMTGFGRKSGETDWGNWVWEVRSVNGRNLDVRINTPSGFEPLDRIARQGIAERFKRGSIQLSLRLDAQANTGNISVDEDALQGLCEAFETRNGAAPNGDQLATLMTIKGVTDTQSTSLRDLAQNKDTISVLTDGVNAVLDELTLSRQKEGETLQTVLSSLLDQMDVTRSQCESLARHQPALLKERLQDRLTELLETTSVDAERLALEAAVSTAKADVREELDRLRSHIQTGREHLATGSPIGRKLDFLAQELNREANTLCSKSASLELTQAGLTLKGLIDQFKEQAANVE